MCLILQLPIDMDSIKRSYLLAGVTVILTLLSVWAAFSKTYSAWKLNQDLNSNLSNSKDINYNPAYMERKFKNIKKIISLYAADSISYRSKVLATVARIADAENVKIVEVPGTEKAPYFCTNIFQIQILRSKYK